jgi:cobalt-precorrin 5A hydrolase
MERDAVIVAGFGFRKAAGVASLQNALSLTDGPVPDALATAADKAASPAFQAFAADMGLPVIPVAPEALEGQDTHTQSGPSQAARNTGSVAEAAALAAAGVGARLLTGRVISDDQMATCALAQSGQIQTQTGAAAQAEQNT